METYQAHALTMQVRVPPSQFFKDVIYYLCNSIAQITIVGFYSGSE